MALTLNKIETCYTKNWELANVRGEDNWQVYKLQLFILLISGLIDGGLVLIK